VKEIGKRESKITRQDVAALLKDAEERGFFASKDNSSLWAQSHELRPVCSDAAPATPATATIGIRGEYPSYVTYTLLRIRDQSRVVDYRCPPGLSPIVRQIELKTHYFRWVARGGFPKDRAVQGVEVPKK
jgi:hypothetical protein